jgi:nickel/cobalt transporter (NicO) family protein
MMSWGRTQSYGPRDIITDILILLVELQRKIHGALTIYLDAFAGTHDWAALAAVLPLGILFGAVHALTPGHSKTVLASYLLGSRLAALRSTTVAGALALTHVGSAVVVVLLALPLITRTLVGAGRAPLLEDVSRGLLAAIGLWLLVRAIWGRAHRHSEQEGVMVGVVAGLVPCPLTLFVMFLAVTRGVPEAGFTFALAMMLGVALTLAGVAVLTVITRDRLVTFTTQHGASIDRFACVLDAAAGALLFAIGIHALLY